MSIKSKGISPLIIILAAIVAIALCFASAPAAQAAESVPTVDEVSSHQVEEHGGDVREEFRFTDGSTVRFDYDRDSGAIKVYRNGMLVGSTNDRRIIRDVKRQLPVSKESSNSAFRSSASRCQTAMGIAGLVNTALWGAAGIVAAPSAGVSVAIGGMITSGVLGVGGMFCR